MMEPPASRICTKCLVEKPLTEFNKCAKGRYGRKSICRECHKTEEPKEVKVARAKKWAMEHPERARQLHRESALRHYYRDQEHSKQKSLDYYWKDPERHRAAHRTWTEANKEYVLEYKANYRTAHQEELLEYARVYKKAHRKEYTLIQRTRRAREKGSKGELTKEEWDTICEEYGNRCLCCGKTGILLTIDHIIPLCHGGRHDITNVQPLCLKCNQKKNIKIIDYRPRGGNA